MKLYLRNLDVRLTAELKSVFKNEPDVYVSQGDIFGLKEKFDAIVSPANSLGWMDGGIDFFYSMYFGWDLQERLQNQINDDFEGELLVGQAAVLSTSLNGNHPLIKNLISAPTMRVPEDVGNTVNAYLAFRAALRAARKHGFETVLSPGMATGVGKIHPTIAAYQMYKAWVEVNNNVKIKYSSIEDAVVAHYDLKGLKMEKFQANFEGSL
jgi:O-acetyl-ADP-ribose deacetylase (regulator of RNase III)